MSKWESWFWGVAAGVGAGGVLSAFLAHAYERMVYGLLVVLAGIVVPLQRRGVTK